MMIEVRSKLNHKMMIIVTVDLFSLITFPPLIDNFLLTTTGSKAAAFSSFFFIIQGCGFCNPLSIHPCIHLYLARMQPRTEQQVNIGHARESWRAQLAKTPKLKLEMFSPTYDDDYPLNYFILHENLFVCLFDQLSVKKKETRLAFRHAQKISLFRQK